MHPSELFIKDFTYQLPDEKIAKYPLAERDQSKLLLYNKGKISHDVFASIGSHLPQDTLLVFNNSRVVEARFIFEKESGGKIEIFALEPANTYMDITAAMNANGHILYKCMVGGASRWKKGSLCKTLPTPDGEVSITVQMVEKVSDGFIIDFSWTPNHLSFAHIMHLAGQLPIPPYLGRPAEKADETTYQTVYATQEGSVAAPTAGLHFTEPLLQGLAAQGVKKAFLTLHVGAGTFLPVKSETIAGHQMHAEFIEADIPLLENLIAAGKVIPVGTTAMRTLESLYWMGVKAYHNPDITLSGLEMQQWEVYDKLNSMRLPANEALDALSRWLRQQGMQRLIIKTQIIIAPGYTFGICSGLITNFHQPQSTLLLLVAALIGNDWQRVYEYALHHEFRFLSYGDSSLLLP